MIELVEKQSSIKLLEGEQRIIVENSLAKSTSVEVMPNSSLIHYRLNKGNDNKLSVKVHEDASYKLITLQIGNGTLDIDVSLEGAKAYCQSDIAYALNKEDKMTIVSNFVHNANETTSNQLIKGVASGNSYATFEGKILIPYDKKKVEGNQQHRALLLSKSATVKAVPALEIYADDVKCSHGSAIGNLNQEQIYYLQTRGISKEEAYKILTSAFLREVTDGIDAEDLRTSFEKEIAECLLLNV